MHCKTFTLFLLAFFASSVLSSQEEKGKEVIIIEKVVDENGNVISKNTKRYNNIYSEDQINDLIEEDFEAMPGTFDLEGLGFEQGFGELFGKRDQRPSIGLNLNFESGNAIVTRVFRGSGAESADIRENDKVLSVNSIPIAAIEDVYEILEGKQAGDRIRLLIFRDGEEIEKEVVLNSGRNQLFFQFPEDGNFDLFGGGQGFSFDLDSIFKSLDFSEDMLRGLNFQLPNGNESDLRGGDGDRMEERASLGVFIDDDRSGVVVTDVVSDSPADKAGLRSGDVILRLDDNVVSSFREISAFMNSKRIGDDLLVKIKRRNKTKDITVKL